MTNKILSSRLKAFDEAPFEARRSALRETMAEIVLAGLSRTNFFAYAALSDDMAMRLCHGLPRFVADLAFLVFSPRSPSLGEKEMAAVEREFLAAGFPLPLRWASDDRRDQNLPSAYVLSVSLSRAFELFWGQEESSSVEEGESVELKIKLEANPVPGFEVQNVFRSFPFPAKLSVLALPSLHSRKIAACLMKKEAATDFYDLAYFSRLAAKLDMAYLDNMLRQSGLFEGDHLDIETVKTMLRERFAAVDDWEAGAKEVRKVLEPDEELRYFEEAFFSSIVSDLQSA